MATPPDFTAGQVLTAAQMNAVGLWAITPTSVSAGATIGTNGAVSFTTQQTISLNGVFTGDYLNYLVHINQTALSGSGLQQIRFRVGGSDDTSSLYNYYLNRLSSLDGSTVASFARTQNIAPITPALGATHSGTFTIFNPQVAQPTYFSGQNVDSSGNMVNNSALFTGTTVFDGFSIIVTATNITGTIRVYGYN
jgi:hypothetical protein